MERKKMISVSMAVLLSAVVLASVLGPEQIARYKDKATLNQIIVEESDSANEGYRYTLSSNEKLFLLSKCLEHQALQENELSAGPGAESSDVDYGELMGAYAFVMNRQGPSGREITAEEIFQICNQEINILRGKWSPLLIAQCFIRRLTCWSLRIICRCGR